MVRFQLLAMNADNDDAISKFGNVSPQPIFNYSFEEQISERFTEQTGEPSARSLTERMPVWHCLQSSFSKQWDGTAMLTSSGYSSTIPTNVNQRLNYRLVDSVLFSIFSSISISLHCLFSSSSSIHASSFVIFDLIVTKLLCGIDYRAQ